MHNKISDERTALFINIKTLVSLVWLLLMTALPCTTATAQNGVQFKDWKPSLNGGINFKPKLDCRALVSMTTHEFSIETATPIAAAGEVPEYCNVTGQILPEIRFEVNLPASWNGRFYMFGNGGYAGEALTAPMRVSSRQMALRRGFAVAQTNTGHDAVNDGLLSALYGSRDGTLSGRCRHGRVRRLHDACGMGR